VWTDAVAGADIAVGEYSAPLPALVHVYPPTLPSIKPTFSASYSPFVSTGSPPVQRLAAVTGGIDQSTMDDDGRDEAEVWIGCLCAFFCTFAVLFSSPASSGGISFYSVSLSRSF
jgi:hypothetical protein